MTTFRNIRTQSLPPFASYAELLNFFPPFDGYTVITIDDDAIYSWNKASQTWIPQPTSGDMNNLNDKEIRTTRFATISSGTIGTITLPPNSTVVLDDFGGTTDAVTSMLDGGRPTYTSALTTLGTVVATTFDAGGNYSLSDTPSLYPIAIIYRVQQRLADFDSTALDIVGGPEIVNVSGGSIAIPINEIVYGTGIGVTSSPSLTFDGIYFNISNGSFNPFRINLPLGVIEIGDSGGSSNHTFITVNDNDQIINIVCGGGGLSFNNVGLGTFSGAVSFSSTTQFFDTMNDGAGFIFLDPISRQLIDSGGTQVLDYSLTDIDILTGNLKISNRGSGLQVKSGANTRSGNVKLVAGSATVSNTTTTPNTHIIVGNVSPSGVPGACFISSRTDGVDFKISSTNPADTSTVSWDLIEEIP